jgi:hypothetical protein
MRSKLLRGTAIVLGCLLAGAAFAADVDARLNAYQSASTEANSVMGQIKDGATAKALQAKLDAALKKRREAEAALNVELKKLNLKDQKDGKTMEFAMGEIAKSNEAMSKEQLRILSDKDAGEVMHKSFDATPAKK